MQEFLVIAVVAVAIFFLPRLLARKSVPAPVENEGRTVLTGRIRLAILLTIFWIAGTAAYLKPWENSTIIYLCVGLGPAAAAWGAAWVWSGYREYRR